MPESLPSGIRAVHGHFRPQRYDGVRNAFRLTFLREPVDNLISIYCFWKNCSEHGNPVHSKFLAEHPSIVDFALYEGIQTLASEVYFGGYDMRRFDFIGFYETLGEDLAKLSARLGIRLSKDVHENKTALGGDERREWVCSPAVVNQLRRSLAQDIRFYESFRAERG